MKPLSRSGLSSEGSRRAHFRSLNLLLFPNNSNVDFHRSKVTCRPIQYWSSHGLDRSILAEEAFGMLRPSEALPPDMSESSRGLVAKKLAQSIVS